MTQRTNPTISVAMCTYNGGRYIDAQLESIRRQELPVSELVVCDDGSSDGTLEILEAFSLHAHFPVLIVRNEKNLGSTKNFEKAIRLCSGNFIALADQDDIWLPNKTAVLVGELVKEAAAGGVFTDAAIIDECSEETGSTLWEEYGFSDTERDSVKSGNLASVLLRRPIVTGATFLFRRELLGEILPIPEGWLHDEWIAWRIALCSSVIFSKIPVMFYRTHASQQIGVPPGVVARLRNIGKALRHGPSLTTKTRVRNEYFHGATELGKLTEGLSERTVRFDNLRNDIRAKIDFCESVLGSFQRRPLQRVGFAVKNVSNYRRFRYLPMYSLLRDLFI